MRSSKNVLQFVLISALNGNPHIGYPGKTMIFSSEDLWHFPYQSFHRKGITHKKGYGQTSPQGAVLVPLICQVLVRQSAPIKGKLIPTHKTKWNILIHYYITKNCNTFFPWSHWYSGHIEQPCQLSVWRTSILIDSSISCPAVADLLTQEAFMATIPC